MAVRAIVLFVVLLGVGRAASVGSGPLHPCRQQRPSVKKGGGFVVGFAFLARGGETDVEWGTPEAGRHPCAPEDRSALGANTVSVSYFNVEVDKLTLVDSVAQLQESLASSAFDNVTVVAFSGGYRSEERVVSLREGERWKIVRSLALIADFSRDGLEQFQWFDLECGECKKTDDCLNFAQQTSCAWTCDPDDAVTCRSEIYISFDGMDRNNEVFNSAAQIRKLRGASVSHLFSSGREFASSVVESSV